MVPEAVILDAPAIEPVLVMPALLLLIPLVAVRTPFEVIVPPLVVAILPKVVRLPNSLIVN
jgi:hypothetical protein